MIDGNLQGTVRLGGTPHFCNSILLDVLLYLQTQYPRLTLELRENDSTAIVREVEEGVLDLGVVQTCDLEDDCFFAEPHRRNLQFTPLFFEDLCVVAGENHPLCGKTFAMEELLQFPYVTYRGSISIYIRNFFQEHDYKGRIIHINEMVSMRRFMFKSNAITVISRRAVRYSNLVYQDKIVPLNIPGLNWRCSVGWIHSRSALSLLEEKVAAALAVHCEQYQGIGA